MLTVTYPYGLPPCRIHSCPVDPFSQLYWAAVRARIQMWDWGTAAYVADDATRGLLSSTEHPPATLSVEF